MSISTEQKILAIDYSIAYISRVINEADTGAEINRLSVHREGLITIKNELENDSEKHNCRLYKVTYTRSLTSSHRFQYVLADSFGTAEDKARERLSYKPVLVHCVELVSSEVTV